MKQVGLNVEYEVKGTVLTVTVDLGKDFGPSKSGKTIIIASTQGNVRLNGSGEGATMGLNIYKHR